MQFWDMSTIRNKKGSTKLIKDLYDKNCDRLLNIKIDETGFQHYVLNKDKDSDRLLNIDETSFQYVVCAHNCKSSKT